MIKFELATDAMREVKKLAGEIDSIHNEIFFVYSDYHEHYYVSDDRDEIEEMILQRWYDSGCDFSPENEADSYKIWVYLDAENKTKYPAVYKEAKKSLINSGVPLIRTKKEVECNYSVEFTISSF